MMETIRSKRSAGFYLAITFSIVFFFGLAGAFGSIAYHSNAFGIFTVLSIIWSILGVAILITYFINAPNITVDNTAIFFNQEYFEWTDIDKIELNGKMPFKFLLINSSMEGTKFQLKNGQVLYMYDNMYSNLWQIKCFIEEVVINKKQDFEIPIQAIKISEIEKEIFVYYKGNFFTSLTVIMIWAIIILMLFGIITDHRAPIILLSGISMSFVVLISFQTYYCGLSNEYLIIKNYHIFWTKRIFNLRDIKEVVLGSYAKRPNDIKIITSDFRIRSYPCCTLSNKNWEDLKVNLETKGIQVRVEGYLY